MKRGKRFATALAILSAAAVLTGCGKSNPNDVPPVGGFPGGIPPGPNGCVPLNAYGGAYGGQAGMIGFNAMNIYWDGRNILAGQVPYKTASGQVMIGAGGTGGPYTRSGVDGVLSMQITQTPTYGGYQPQPYSGTTGATTANATGYVQISSAALQDLMNQYGGGMYGGGYQPYNPYQPGGMPQPGMYQPQTCVSGLAIEGQWAPSSGFYGTWVYVYLNNTQHGYRLYF
jgi:hypothetical protein